MVKIEKVRGVFPFLLRAIIPFNAYLIGEFIVVLFWAVDLSVRPYLIKQMLNKIMVIKPADAMHELKIYILAYLGMALLLFILFRLRDLIWLKVSPNLKKYVALLLMNKMVQHSYLFYQQHFSGALSNKISDVVSGIPTIVRLFIDEFVGHAIAILVAVYTLSTVNIHFSLALIVWITIYLAVSIKMSLKGTKLADHAAEKRSVVIGYIVDTLANMMSVRLFGMQQAELQRIEGAMQISVEADQARNWFYAKIYAFQGLSFIIFQAVCFWWLVKGFMQGTVTPGDFAMTLSINLSLVNCLWSISKDIREFSESFGNVTQGLRVVEIEINVMDIPGAHPLQVSEGVIVFDNVDFKYEGADLFFENKSVIIYGGQKVGLVGYSGSGKTTFVHLILRLFDVTDGAILIDGQDIRTVTQQSLREAIGMIPQDPALFHRSIMENIRYGKSTATDQEVVAAAKKAHAHDFIVHQEFGYQTMVGERGTKLSGGQRQRISIARAILKNAPILILDEATSQLDSITETLIQDSLWQLMQDKTTLVIAHRLSTLLQMDRILVFDQGTIIEDGTHDQLLAQGGLYSFLWQAQIDGSLPEAKYMEGVEH